MCGNHLFRKNRKRFAYAVFYSRTTAFSSHSGYTVRADFDGGALSSDFGALLLRGIDRQIGLTERLAAAVQDKRHPSYTDHPLRDLLAQRIYQIASGYADGNDANSLRHDPMFKLSMERPPLEPDPGLGECPDLLAAGTQRGPQGPLPAHPGVR